MQGGHGGFLETSGKQYLDAKGYADLTSRYDGYNKGTYLLDPANITIYGNVDPTFVSTDSSLDLNTNLQLWFDGSDRTQLILTYSTDSLSSATASGTSGTNTITTSADVSATLRVGSRIRLGAAGAETSADTLGADTYTITAIAGTTITVSETLTATYSESTLRRGLVSRWNDKSDNNVYVTEATNANQPMYIDSGINNLSSIFLDGTNDRLVLSPPFDLVRNVSEHSIYSVFNNLNSGDQYGALFVSTRETSGNSRAALYASPTLIRAAGRRLDSDGYQEVTVGLSTDTDSIGSAIFNYGNAQLSVGLNGAYTDRSGGFQTAGNTSDTNSVSSAIGSNGLTPSDYFRGYISNIITYGKATSTTERNLIDQYKSAQWSIALDPTTASDSEATEAMSATGFSLFAASYLERLSASADIILQADTSITLDLKGDTLTLDDDRSITVQTTNGDISTDSAGTIVTNRTTTGGNISFTAGGSGDIIIDHALTLNAQNGGVTTFTAGDDLTVNAELSGTGQMIFDITDDVTLNADISTTSSLSNALVVSAGDDFINTAGSDGLEANNSRWLLYSDAPTGNTRDGLLPSTSEFNKNYASNAPGTIAGTDNRFIYNTATALTLVYQVGNDTVEYGDSYSSTPTLTYSSGLLAGDSLATIGLSGSASPTTTYNAGDNVASYSGVLSATSGNLSNSLGYDYSFLSGDLTVIKATLTASLLNSSPLRQVGQANPNFALSYSGFKLSDTANSLDIAPLATTLAGLGSGTGVYDITLTAGSDSNYDIQYSNPVGSLTITQSPLINKVTNAAQTITSNIGRTVLPTVNIKQRPTRTRASEAAKVTNRSIDSIQTQSLGKQQTTTLKQPTHLSDSGNSNSAPVPYYSWMPDVMPGGPPVHTKAAPRMTMFDGLVEVTPEVVAMFDLDRRSPEEAEKLGLAIMDDEDEDQ